MIEFSVGNFRVDMARSQIIAQDNILSMEPKVLQVLLLLAENQGEVVSHDTILDKIWPNVHVAPNVLQRCIAQLRKAFNDDAKSQQVIATHPKVGYSLVANVNWQTKLELNTSNVAKLASVTISEKSSLIANSWLILSLIFVFLLVIYYLLFKPANYLPISQVTALTATDQNEFSPSYSPDGRYIAFQRNLEACKNQLWAKDTQTNKEYLLTKDPGIYGTPSWSPDGKQLVFSNVTQCNQTGELIGCREIRAVSLGLAKSLPQKTRQVLACDQQDYSAVIWLNNDKLAYIKSDSDKEQIMSLSLPDKKETTLYTAQNSYFYSLNYSTSRNKLAVTLYDEMRNYSIALINPDNLEQDQFKLKPPEKFKYKNWWTASWHPSDDSLLTSASSSLFEIDLDGNFTEYTIPSLQGISDPVYHPDSTKIVAAMGLFDIDLGELSWTQTAAEISSDSDSYSDPVYKIINRSNVSELDGKYQPQGEGLAFLSDRSGSRQIWLDKQSIHKTTSSEQALQLSFVEDNSKVDSFQWSIDGRFIMFAADRKLNLLNLDGEVQQLITPFEVLDIYQIVADNQVLLSVVDQQRKVVLYNFETKEAKTIFIGFSYHALQSSDNKIIIVDNEGKLNQVIDSNVSKLPGFEDQLVKTIFLGKNQTLFLETKNGNLLTYNLNTHNKSTVLSSLDDVKQITDVDTENNRLLFMRLVSVKREIVVFQ